jgi:hypothetical protein
LQLCFKDTWAEVERRSLDCFKDTWAEVERRSLDIVRTDLATPTRDDARGIERAVGAFFSLRGTVLRAAGAIPR